MTVEETRNRHTASLAEPYPVFTPSPEAVSEIDALDSRVVAGTITNAHYFHRVYDILVEDQSKYGLRVHKGNPLYWLAVDAGESDRDKSLKLMLEAFVEDVLTHGHRALQGFASSSLRNDFGIPVDTLIRLKEFVIEKIKPTFLPASIVDEFRSTLRTDAKTKETFTGVSEGSLYDAVVDQVKETTKNHLRPSFKIAPSDEAQVQNVVYALLRQIDSRTEREKKGVKHASKDFTVDFSLFQNKICVEVKLVRDKSRLGSIIDEINADITPYLQDFKRVVFVVFDATGAMNDPSRFAADIQGSRKEIAVLVV